MLRRLVSVFAALFLCVLIQCGCNNSTSRERGRGAAATEAVLSPAEMEVAYLLEDNIPFEFDFDLEDVAGNRLSKADLAGKVLIVDLWGTWCPPCRMEIPHFVALNKKYQEQGLAIVGLNSERTRDKAKAARLVREFCTSEGVDYPCAVVTEEVLEQVPDIEGFPTTLFFDRTGRVRLRATGYHDASFLEAAVEALLREKPAAGG
jgi:thiol-disulfide isomerase/thioredoxin